MNTYLRHILLALVLAAASTGIVWADDDFNPENPPEPMTQVAVTVAADPAEGASSISSGGSYSIGRQLSISVSVKNGYRLLYWTLNGEQYTTSASFYYTVGDSAVSFVAVLANNPTISVSVSPEGAGSAYGGGTYAPGSKRQIYTYANSGYTFLYWTLNGEQYTTASSFYYTMGEQDVAFVAVYKDNNAEPEPDPDEPFNPDNPAEPDVYYQVSVATNLPDGVQPSYITRGGYFAPGRQLTISTTVPSAYTFLFWTLNSEPYTTSTSFSYTVGDSAANFVAMFQAKQQVTVAVTPEGAGSVSAGGWFDPNTQIMVSTTPASGYTFLYWTLNGEEYATTTSFYYYVGSTKAEFVAVYEPIPEPEQPEENEDDEFVPSNPKEPGEPDRVALLITALSADTTMGTVAGVPATPLFEGDQITLTATPRPGYMFSHWQDYDTSNPRTIVLTGDAVYKAYFVGEEYTITFYDDDCETILSQQLWQYGQIPECISPAKAEDDEFTYRFIGWTPEVVPVTEPAEYYAVYEAIEKTLTDLQYPTDQQSAPRKIIRDSQLLILRDGKIYTIQGCNMNR